MARNVLAGIIPCRIQRLAYGPWVVTLHDRDGATLFFQSDTDQAAFAVSCDAINAPRDWNGEIQALGVARENVDPETIQSCPEEYLHLAARE